MARRRNDEVENIEVKVIKFGGRIVNVSIEEGSTVEDAIKASELEYSGSEVSLNGDDADLNDEVFDGDTVTISSKIKGGC